MLSCPIGLASILLVFNAFNWDFETAFNPFKAIAYQPNPSFALRWGWFLDILGYYLLLTPAMICLHHWLSPRAPLYSKMFAFFGLGYILMGAMGAAVLAGVTQPLFAAYNTGDMTQKMAIGQIYASMVHAVMDGIWNIFSMLMGTIWWLGTGWLLRSERKWLALFFTFIGIASLLDVVGVALQTEWASTLGLNIYLWFAPFATLWLGAILWKQGSLSTQQN